MPFADDSAYRTLDRREYLVRIRHQLAQLERSIERYKNSYRTDLHKGKRDLAAAEHSALELVDLIRLLPTERSAREKVTLALKPTHGHKKTKQVITKLKKAVFRYVH